MDSRIYWPDREAKQKEILYDKVAKDFDKELLSQYSRCFKDTKTQLIALYADLKANPEGIKVQDLYKFNRYYVLMNELNKRLNKLGSKEVQLTDNKLTEMYKVSAKITGEAIHFSPTFNSISADKCIHGIWCSDGQHWSDRIWNDKSALQERIEKGIIDCVARGTSKDVLVKQLQKDLSVGYYQSMRIARTELSYVQNKATLDKYEEAGIEKYKFFAEIDSRTSAVCKENDGKIFLLKDAQVGVNYPPLHPNCRSTVLAVF